MKWDRPIAVSTTYGRSVADCLPQSSVGQLLPAARVSHQSQVYGADKQVDAKQREHTFIVMIVE